MKDANNSVCNSEGIRTSENHMCRKENETTFCVWMRCYKSIELYINIKFQTLFYI